MVMCLKDGIAYSEDPDQTAALESGSALFGSVYPDQSLRNLWIIMNENKSSIPILYCIMMCLRGLQSY